MRFPCEGLFIHDYRGYGREMTLHLRLVVVAQGEGLAFQVALQLLESCHGREDRIVIGQRPMAGLENVLVKNRVNLPHFAKAVHRL